MKIDLHIHTKTGSDGNLPVEGVFAEASRRGIQFISITDHDNISTQQKAQVISNNFGMKYVTGVELNVSFQYPGSKVVSLDYLGYNFDIFNTDLNDKLKVVREHREKRAIQILENLNIEFVKENRPIFTTKDLENIQESVDGTFGRPHIANYLISKGIVKDKQEAFDRYLVKCDVPKYPLTLAEASRIIRNAGGVLILAHPDDPNGTSLRSVTSSLNEQIQIISQYMLKYIDGVEVWHSRHAEKTRLFYHDFATRNRLLMTGGSDCHQKPITMGTVEIPDFVSSQFNVP